MTNTAQQGADFERAVIHHLEGCQSRPEPCKNTQHAGWLGYGYDCIRSAASKGKADIVAVGPLRTYGLGEEPDAQRLIIQCKRTNPMISPAERAGILDLALRTGGLAIVAHWAPNEDSIHRRMKIHYRRLTGPGPKEWAPWAPGEDN